MEIRAAISAGELFDKISVLDIKHDKLAPKGFEHHTAAFYNVKKEREILLDLAEHLWKPGIDNLFSELKLINIVIWNAVDDLHVEDKKWFKNPWKIAKLARVIYVENDRRAEVKRKINEILSSEIVEEKVYR